MGRSPGSVVGLEIMLWLGRSGVRISATARDFSFSETSRPSLGPIRPPIRCVQGIKWPGLEGDYTPPYNAEIKNKWNYTSAAPLRLYGVNKFTFTFY
jgi:hypothetical protein